MNLLTDFLVINFHQLAEMHLKLHNLQQHQYLLLIWLMGIFNKST